jgi:hypothetical protein
MMMNAPGAEGPDDPEDTKTPSEPPAKEGEKAKPVGKIALKKKPSKPPWAVDLDVKEVGPGGLTPVDPPKEK